MKYRLALLLALSAAAAAARADEPLVTVTAQVPESRAAQCAKDGCLLMTEEELASFVRAAIEAHRVESCKSEHV